MKKLIFVLPLILSILILPAYSAFDGSKLEDALPSAAKEIMGDASVETISPEGIFSRLADYILEHLRSELSSVLAPVGAVIAAAVLSSIAESVQIKKDFDYVNLAACLVIAVGAIADVNSVASMGREAVAEIHEFSLVLMPVLASAAAAAGAISSAAAKYAATALFLDWLMTAAQNIVLPMLGAYMAALLGSAVTGDGRLKGAVKLMKWLCKKALTGLVALFTFYLSLTGIAASGADAAAVKTTKAVIGSFVPVVGKMVAGASESLAAGAGFIRNSVGIFGLAGVCAVCAAPFLAIGLRYILFKATAAVVGFIAGDRIASLVDGIGQAYGMLLGLVGTSAVFMFISILSLIRTVV